MLLSFIASAVFSCEVLRDRFAASSRRRDALGGATTHDPTLLQCRYEFHFETIRLLRSARREKAGETRSSASLDTAGLLLLTLQVPSLILGSASPRRARILAGLGIPFQVRASAIPEAVEDGEDAAAHTSRLAGAKALAVAGANPGAWVLGADTVVVLGGEILGKPKDEADARRVLSRLSAREHQVVTGVALVAPDGELREEHSEESAVRFRKLNASEIASYVATGEPLDKAGSYAIQGGAADFVARLRGSYENVVGLPIEPVREMLRRAGLYPPRVGA